MYPVYKRSRNFELKDRPHFAIIIFIESFDDYYAVSDAFLIMRHKCVIYSQDFVGMHCINSALHQHFRQLLVALILLGHLKSFDTVDHKLLFPKLSQLFHFSSSAINLICYFLSEGSNVLALTSNFISSLLSIYNRMFNVKSIIVFTFY